MFFTQDLQNKAAQILAQAGQKQLKIATAESCTGGLLAALLTEISGSSKVFERGFVVYANEAKMQMLNVEVELLQKYGAVSEQVAVAMAQGALKNSFADVAIAITGIAGPDGGSDLKPVGLVHIAALNKNYPQRIIKRKFIFNGQRLEVRKAALVAALEILCGIIII